MTSIVRNLNFSATTEIILMEEFMEHQPNYYAIIPANVRYDKDLEPNAKLLYAEITALWQREGYCWASNAYFAKLYDVEIRTVRMWIESLKKKKYIVVEQEKGEFNAQRKIWNPLEFQKSFTEGKKFPPYQYKRLTIQVIILHHHQ